VLLLDWLRSTTARLGRPSENRKRCPSDEDH
jgi:hypothetical protein